MTPKKHARSESQTQDDYIQVDNALKHPSPKRAKQIDEDTPYENLCELIDETREKDSKVRNVLHWFRSKDIRQEDNKGLHAAAQKAKEGNANLITMYLFSPKDMEWHGTSPARSDFILESLRILKGQLEEKNIPLAIVVSEERGTKTQKVMDFVKENDVSHIYANMEYEVDELRRDISVAKDVQKEKDLAFEVLHDQTVVIPGTLTTGNGGPMKVFTPYHKAWLAETKSEPSLLDTVPSPEGNDKSAAETFKALFDTKVPDLPESKQYSSKEDRDRLRKLWPAGNEAGMKRLQHFLDKKVAGYMTHRSEPARDPSSRLSPYFASGIISVRDVLARTKKHNGGKHFDAGDRGIDSWVREIVFREFYRQTLVTTPHTSMNLPQNLKFDFVHWEDDAQGWQKWCEGQTGVPWIDAGMRQLNTEAYMHNRLRMNTSSYLRANLLIDYRKGERYFAERLIDWDLSNNTQGWEPSYTIFNPVTQAEKCDPKGEYIRKWVPELAGLKGKEIFAPYERLGKAEFEKLGYPRPHVDYSETAQRAKERYKRDLHSAEL
ncbi:deoxyribodipyrimidine photo-lyase [Hortaea werneckii]|nr:deoxyribodipyrimidine photo-lyase [Hortaea werneckii]